MTNNVININSYLRAKDIQQLFGIHRNTVDNWAKKGFLIRHKIGRNIFYNMNEVKRLMN